MCSSALSSCTYGLIISTMAVERDKAWIVVASSDVIMFVGPSTFVSYGSFVATVQVETNFPSYRIWILNIMYTLFCVSAILVAPLAKFRMFTYKKITLIGCVLAVSGLLLTSAVTLESNPMLGFFTLSFLVGVGLGLMVAGTFLLVALHFDKYRGLATGIGIVSAGVGNLLSPFIYDWIQGPKDNLNLHALLIAVAFMTVSCCYISPPPLPPRQSSSSSGSIKLSGSGRKRLGRKSSIESQNEKFPLVKNMNETSTSSSSSTTSSTASSLRPRRPSLFMANIASHLLPNIPEETETQQQTSVQNSPKINNSHNNNPATSSLSLGAPCKKEIAKRLSHLNLEFGGGPISKGDSGGGGSSSSSSLDSNQDEKSVVAKLELRHSFENINNQITSSTSSSPPSATCSTTATSVSSSNVVNPNEIIISIHPPNDDNNKETKNNNLEDDDNDHHHHEGKKILDKNTDDDEEDGQKLNNHNFKELNIENLTTTTVPPPSNSLLAKITRFGGRGGQDGGIRNHVVTHCFSRVWEKTTKLSPLLRTFKFWNMAILSAMISVTILSFPTIFYSHINQLESLQGKENNVISSNSSSKHTIGRQDQGKLMLNMIFTLDLISRLVVSFMSDYAFFNRRLIFLCSALCGSAIILVIGFIEHIRAIYFFSILYGLSHGALIATESLMFADAFGIHELASSYGLVGLVKGVMILIMSTAFESPTSSLIYTLHPSFLPSSSSSSSFSYSKVNDTTTTTTTPCSDCDPFDLFSKTEVNPAEALVHRQYLLVLTAIPGILCAITWLIEMLWTYLHSQKAKNKTNVKA